MCFTESDILRLCPNRNVFANGRRYYESGRIKKIERSNINSAETYVYAKVRGTQMYNVTIWFEDGRISHKLCDCQSFHKHEGICKHIVAVLLECMGVKKGDEVSTSVATAPEMSRLIREYTNQNNAEAINSGKSEKISLVPSLAIDENGEIRLGIKVGGAGRKYVVKDICKFSHGVENGEVLSYGKSFSFLHAESSFDAKSKKLLDLIRKSVRENEIYNNAYNKYSYLKTLSAREIVLSPILIDELMEICLNGCVNVTTKNCEDSLLEVVDKNPSVRVLIEKYGDDGAILTLNSGFVFEGGVHCYVCEEDKIYRCDEKYSDAMAKLLKVAAVSNRKALTISRDDMIYFCNNVLPVISGFVEIAAEDIDLEKYSMPEATVRFFIDNPEPGIITCKTECVYGEIRCDLLEHADENTYRDAVLENGIKNCLMQYFQYNDDGIMEIRYDDDAIFYLADKGLDEMSRFGEVYISEQFERLRIAPVPQFTAGISLSGGLLHFELNSDELNFRELSKILKSYREKKKYHRLPDGAFLKLEASSLAAVAEVVGGLDAESYDGDESVITLPKYRAIYVDNILKGEVNVHRSSSFKELIRSMKSVADSDFSVPKSLDGTLRSFQKTGFRWLKTLDYYGLGGILADEMGLGKTLQIITLFLSAKEENDFSTALIVCPASLVYNWESEIQRFAPSLKTCVIGGTLEERKELIEKCESFDVVITSYDLLKRDIELYEDISFRFEVVDEAQYIKNYFTQSARAVKRVNAQSRFALTGTPIENRMSELWSIFDYLMPGFLYSYKKFREEFESPIVREKDERALTRLHRMIAPFILRRLKRDVLRELPEKLEQVVISKMEPEQEKIYYARAKQLKDSIKRNSGGFENNTVKVLAELTRLRQICCEPSLVYENYNGGAAKLENCMEIVRESLENGHKVLIFSQFTSMLEIFEKRLRREKIDFYTLTGATSKEKRMALVNNFQNGTVPVFLISVKAGGTGLNLTAADVVIHYDPWWNVAAQNQATDRAHRIGQKHAVTVYRLIAKGTVEESILRLQESKKELAESIINEIEGEDRSITKENILAILDGN